MFVFFIPLSTIMILDRQERETCMQASIPITEKQSEFLKWAHYFVSCLLIYPFLHFSSIPQFCIKLPLNISSKVERKKGKFLHYPRDQSARIVS